MVWDLSGGPADQVVLLQGEIIEQSNIVFDAMRELADDSTEKALEANLTVDTTGLPNAPIFPTVDLSVSDYAAALAYLGTLRDGLLAIPVYPADYTETDYSSTLLAALVNLLYSDLINGGYGIDTSDEESIWNRGRERVMKESATEQEAVTRQFAIAGFPMPTGAAVQAIQAAQEKASLAIADFNRDQTIKRADLFVENRKHAMTVSADVEKTRMGNFNSKMDRLLEHYKANVTKVTEDYRTRATVYTAIANAYVSLFGTNAGLAQAQAQLAIGMITAEVAVYRAEMDKVFEKAKLELEGKKTAASIFAAIATAAMSTMNVNTSMGAQATASISGQGTTNYNYEM